nr:hypothetical protein [Microtetraspora sp. NBRC 16547]
MSLSCPDGSGWAWRNALLNSSLTTRTASSTVVLKIPDASRSELRRRRAAATLASAYGNITTLDGLTFPLPRGDNTPQ